MSRHLRVPVADTVLDCNDTEGSGQEVLLLNGAFATQRHWKKVLPLLADRYRVVTFDGRLLSRPPRPTSKCSRYSPTSPSTTH